METLRVALVGAGQMGRLHARVVAETPGVRLAAVVEPDAAANPLPYAGASTYESVGQLLQGAAPDLAIVAVPTVDHAAVTEPLLAARVPVLLEKPIAATVADARRLIEIAQASGVAFTVGHVERFNPAVRALRNRLLENELGRVFQVHARRLSPFPRRIGDTGVALDLATHDLDVMCELAGEPLRVAAEVDRRAHRTREDLLVATLRFESGIIGLLEANWLTPAKVRRLTVTGERGMFVVDYLAQHLTLYENAHASEAWMALDIFDGVTEGNVTRFAIAREEPLRAQLSAFVRAVRGDAPVVVTPESALHVLELAFAAVEAGERGETIVLPRAAAAVA